MAGEGIPGFGSSFTIGGVTVGDILEITPPEALNDAEITYTPISGANSGKEIVVPGKHQKRTATVKFNCQEANFNAILAKKGTRIAIAVGLPAGVGNESGTGILSQLKKESVNDTGIITATATLALDGAV